MPRPRSPRNLWQFFNKIEQNDKKKWRSECQCCGQKYWDLSPYKIFDHFGYPLTRQTLLKFKPCSGIDKDEHKDVKATVQRIHAAEFAKKSALKLATAQGSRTQPTTSFFHDRGVNVQAARASGHLPVSESPIRAAPGAAQFKHQRGRITSRVREPRSTGGAVTEAVGGR